MDKPSLEKIFSKSILKVTSKRNEKISEAVQRYGYLQREGANYLEMYFTSSSRKCARPFHLKFPVPFHSIKKEYAKKIDLTLLIIEHWRANRAK